MSEIRDSGLNAGAATLISEVYPALRRVAASKLAKAGPENSLEATGLVHEAYLRLAGADQSNWSSREHFFSAAADAMRSALVDRARKRNRAKRGGGARPVEIEVDRLPNVETDSRILQIHDALDSLALEDEAAAMVVKLSYFMGLTHAEIADVLNVSEKTVGRRWNYARTRLYQLIQDSR